MTNDRLPPALPMRALLAPYPTLAPWMGFAAGEMGEREVPGDGDNARILEYLETVLITRVRKWFRDETAWCAAFVQWCLKQCGIEGTGKPNARSYLDYGAHTDLPAFGDLVVFKRGLLWWQGHVAFFVRFEGTADAPRIIVRGGNQNNRVSDQARKVTDVIAYRKITAQPKLGVAA